jgi:hypothetical protein
VKSIGGVLSDTHTHKAVADSIHASNRAQPTPYAARTRPFKHTTVHTGLINYDNLQVIVGSVVIDRTKGDFAAAAVRPYQRAPNIRRRRRPARSELARVSCFVAVRSSRDMATGRSLRVTWRTAKAREEACAGVDVGLLCRTTSRRSTCTSPRRSTAQRTPAPGP